MTFARETGGDLRAGSTMTTAKGKFVSSRASTRSASLVERQNGIMRTGPFERSSKRIPNSSTEAHRHSDSEAGSRPNLRPSSNRMDDANRVRTH